MGLFAPPLRAAVSAEALRLAWTAEAAGQGGVTAIEEPVTEAGETDPVRVRIPVTCIDGRFVVVTSVGEDGLLQGLRLDAHGGAEWRPPHYADGDRFTERDILLGDGPLEVPGTLTLPAGCGPWPPQHGRQGGAPDRRRRTVGRGPGDARRGHPADARGGRPGGSPPRGTTTAAQLACPMLILQGERDYQVTVADDLTGWQRALAGRPEVTIRIHEIANHLFFAGSGRSTPAEYARPGHVDPAVVEEIATWLARR
ncbi:hypothetical protein AB0C93_12235 [Streptomyces sp. NPDC048518]|uniref:hypothetical protein n=1 Tax=Streptomyces sp. NPDC048518 TaxID=3155029 RepID=UPI0033CFBE94